MKAHQSSNVISWGRYPGLKSALHMADNWFYAGILCPQAGITRPIELPPSCEYSLETLKWESIELVDFLLESSVSHGEGLRWRQRGRAGISKPAILTTMAVLVVDSHRCCNVVFFVCSEVMDTMDTFANTWAENGSWKEGRGFSLCWVQYEWYKLI